MLRFWKIDPVGRSQCDIQNNLFVRPVIFFEIHDYISISRACCHVVWRGWVWTCVCVCTHVIGVYSISYGMINLLLSLSAPIYDRFQYEYNYVYYWTMFRLKNKQQQKQKYESYELIRSYIGYWCTLLHYHMYLKESLGQCMRSITVKSVENNHTTFAISANFVLLSVGLSHLDSSKAIILRKPRDRHLFVQVHKINSTLIVCYFSFSFSHFHPGYPLAIYYRKQCNQLSKYNKNLYIFGSGLLLCLFNYGWLAYHSFTAVLASYVFITLLNGQLLVTASFLFHMTYLMVGYYVTATETYDITWTMPHCVLTLRLIGLAFDIADGQRPDDKLSATQKKSCLKEKPGFLEIAAYTYFPGSFLVGPQFSFRRYQSFINKEFDKYDGCLEAGAKRAAVGACYLAVNLIGSSLLPERYMLSDEFTYNNILVRLLLAGVWGRITLYKYISCWLLTESVCICFGEFSSDPLSQQRQNEKYFFSNGSFIRRHHIQPCGW